VQASSVVNVLVTQFQCKMAIKSYQNLMLMRCAIFTQGTSILIPNENNFDTKTCNSQRWKNAISTSILPSDLYLAISDRNDTRKGIIRQLKA
jgi:hypothetical protein